jgi:DNA-binding transcriptional regulator PaaX
VIDLYPTPSRLALLRDVDAGHVWSTNGAAFNGASGRTRRVNTAVQEMRQAGWIEAQYGNWRLTDRGHAVLAGGAR